MQADYASVYRAARRSYEGQRLVVAGRNAAIVASVVTAVFGTRALGWVPATFGVLVFTEWRGLLLARSARRGVAAGLASALLPLSVLRPCCGVDAKAMHDAACCTMPSACWAVGIFVGLVMALLVPKAPPGKGVEAAAGMILGVTCVAAARCSMLFFGEGAGLLGGVAAGVVATSLARAWMDRAWAKGSG